VFIATVQQTNVTGQKHTALEAHRMGSKPAKGIKTQQMSLLYDSLSVRHQFYSRKTDDVVLQSRHSAAEVPSAD